MKRALCALLLALGLVGAAPPPAVNDALIRGETLPAHLSDFGLLLGPQGLILNAGVSEYHLNTPLFSDYALKSRFVYLPKGQKIGWRERGVLDFPVGSVLIKSFAYPADLRAPEAGLRVIETRLLLHRASGWVALPYVWKPDGSDAELRRAGTRLPIRWIDAAGQEQAISYAVPNANQCKGCHDRGGVLTPIGPKAINLNDGAQLEGWRAAHRLDRLPANTPRLPRWDDDAAPIEGRARAYLDVNCAHCHSREGPANTSGLWLGWDQSPGPNLGIGKRPTAAGRGSGNRDFAIAPGHPEQSYLLYRMQSLDPGVAMPELGRASVHAEGVALIADWIGAMR